MSQRVCRSSQRRRAFASLRIGLAASLCIGLVSCAQYTDYDPGAGLTKEDYTGLLSRRGPAQQGMGEEPPIPDFQPVLAAPSAPDLADVRRVSISVTDTTPLRDILIELARKAQVDLEMDPRISGGIIYTATDRPFIEVIDRIAALGELRYEFKNNTLRVELDEPYIDHYRMDFPAVSRTSSSASQTTTDVSDAIQGASSGSGSSQSDINVSSSSSTNFWAEVGEGIQQILDSTNPEVRRARQAQRQSFQPQATATQQSGNQQGQQNGAGQQSDTQGLVESASGQPGLENPLLADRGAGNVQSLGEEQTANLQGAFFTLNEQAGIITVFASQRQHKLIGDYLQRVRNAVLTQVLIEAKIVEVSLSDNYRTGINWSSIGEGVNGAWTDNNQSLDLNTNFARQVATDTAPDPTIGLVWNNTDLDLNVAVSLVNQFGTTRTLSSPRITVVNNQTALLKVAENEVFFQLDVQEETDQQTNITTLTVDSEVSTVPVGITMAVQPAVNPETKSISLSMRPAITRLVRRVEDPAVQLQLASINARNGTSFAVSSAIPVIEIRELDSIVTMESGQVVVMGGLMQEISIQNREGAPGLMDVPVLGRAFGLNTRETEVVELVIFIRATVVTDRDSVADEDIRIYNTFAPDPRPIAF